MALVLSPSLPPKIFKPSSIRSLLVHLSAMDSSSGSGQKNISLPPISSLMHVASETNNENGPQLSPQAAHARHVSSDSLNHPSGQERLSLANSPRSHHPATPPLPPTSSFDFPHHATSNTSPSSVSAPNGLHYGQTQHASGSETYASRTSSYPPLPDTNSLRPSAYPPIPDEDQWRQHPPEASNYGATGRPPPQNAYPDPSSVYPPMSSYQRPLPTNFPPPPHGYSMPPIDPQVTQGYPPTHHHYQPQQGVPTYPRGSQGNYNCPQCPKSFSRPSSLKIHSHSHTGEKPFACSTPRCGKTFSVRSNMKRHEKGCQRGQPDTGSVDGGNASGASGSPRPG